MTRPVSQLRAIQYALIAFALWVLADAGLKLAAAYPMPPYETAMFMSLFGELIMLVKVRPMNFKSLVPSNPGLQFCVALLGLGCNWLNVIALKHVPLTLFYITVFTAPMMTLVLSAVFLREALSLPKIAAVLVGFGGVVIAVDPFGALSGGDAVGYCAALGSALCFACGLILSRIMTQKDSTDNTLLFYSITQTAVAAVAMVFHSAAPGMAYLMLMLATAAINTVGLFFYFSAVKHAAAATVIQYHYTQLITGALVGYILWQEVPSLHLLIGAAVIALSGLYIARHTHQAETAAAAMTPPPA